MFLKGFWFLGFGGPGWGDAGRREARGTRGERESAGGARRRPRFPSGSGNESCGRKLGGESTGTTGALKYENSRTKQ